MKRIGLTIIFAIYTFFIPFVIVNCAGAPDEPFALDPNVSAETTDEDRLAQCQEMEFLIDECVDVLQAENDRIEAEHAQVTAAEALIADFAACQAYDGTSTATTASTSTATTLIKFVTTAGETTDGSELSDLSECPDTVASVVDAYQVCVGLDADEQYDECDDVIDAVDEATELCDETSDEVTTSFCSLLSA